MKVCLVGMGCGPETLTQEAKCALEEAELLIGPQRLLDLLPGSSGTVFSEYRAPEIIRILQREKPEQACVLLSGDSGFFSGAASLLPLLRETSAESEVFPGISSVQVLAARLGIPWQDWHLVSAHGQACDPVAELMSGKPCFFLTSGAEAARTLCREISEAGLGKLHVAVGENLGQQTEQVFRRSAEELTEYPFSPLNVLLVEAVPVPAARTPGIPDEAFIRSQIPMTKQEVRAAALARLAVTPRDVCWDIGSGTGSVGVEMAMHSSAVWAVEEKAEAVELIRKNREHFRVWNLRIRQGSAPEALEGLPKPDAVFIGGSGGRLPEILNALHHANPDARICISAITLETLQCALDGLQQWGLQPEVAQISVSRSRQAGASHLLLAQNPVFLISGAAP